MNIAENLRKVKLEVPDNVKLIAISKTKTSNEIMEVYNAGHKIFGENKVQELVPKFNELPKDIEWHLVGHLQTNKVKFVAPFVHLIHSVDSLHLLKEINKQGEKCNRVINCLLQVYIAKEETKFGLNESELIELLNNPEYKTLTNVQINGLMGIASFTDNNSVINSEFQNLKQIFENLKKRFFNTTDTFCELSMGMSSDYVLAIKNGATMVRVGSKIFGERTYSVK